MGEFIQDTIALVYDFDGTLSPQPMQEYTVLPELGIEPAEFWGEVNQQAQELCEEPMLTYMRLLVEKAEEKRLHIGSDEFRALGDNVQYFPGVESWFARINDYVRSHGGEQVQVKHYVISAGLREILDGVSVRDCFEAVFASEYHYNHHRAATFPKLLITDTTKTQFLFRINKGKVDIRDSINTHMSEDERPIPFENIIYIGDGETDVPSMAVTRQQGGNSIAVYKDGESEREARTRAICRELLGAGRVNFIAPADYSAGGVMERRVQLLLSSVIAKINYNRELFACRTEQA